MGREARDLQREISEGHGDADLAIKGGASIGSGGDGDVEGAAQQKMPTVPVEPTFMPQAFAFPLTVPDTCCILLTKEPRTEKLPDPVVGSMSTWRSLNA